MTGRTTDRWTVSHSDGASAQSMMVMVVLVWVMVMIGHAARDPAAANGASPTGTPRAWRRRRRCRSSWRAAAVATGHDEHVTPGGIVLADAMETDVADTGAAARRRRCRARHDDRRTAAEAPSKVGEAEAFAGRRRRRRCGRGRVGGRHCAVVRRVVVVVMMLVMVVVVVVVNALMIGREDRGGMVHHRRRRQ